MANHIDPEELARRIAARLAAQREVEKVGFSRRNNVLVARLVAGVIILTTAGVLVFGVYSGSDLVNDRASPDPPQVLSERMTPNSVPDATGATSFTPRIEDFMGIFGNASESADRLGPVASTIPGNEIGVPMPPPSTTSTSVPGVVSSSTTIVTTNPTRVTTTQPSTTVPTTTIPPTTTTTTVPTTTIPLTTTTITVPTTTIPLTTTTITVPTTTIPLTTTTITVPTTTILSTTTTVDDTTTACGNPGQGNRKC